MQTRGFVLATLVIAPASLPAGCGSSAKSPNTKIDPALEASRCTRSHGVPNFPDPSAGGELEITPGS